MSVVACRVSEGGQLEIAADSITVRGYSKRNGDNTKFSKLFRENGVTVGAVGTCEETSLLALFLRTHQVAGASEVALLEFIGEFVEWKKKKTDKGGVENSYIMCIDGVAFSLERWHIENIETFTAIGAGMDFALAAMHLGHSAAEAVEVACELSIFCESPVQTMGFLV